MMNAKLLLLTFSAYLLVSPTLGQRQWIDQATTAQEMRNPYTWYRPYYQAAGEAYSRYRENAREIRQQLYQQAYATGAFGRPNGGQQNPPNQQFGPNQPSQQFPSNQPNQQFPQNQPNQQFPQNQPNQQFPQNQPNQQFPQNQPNQQFPQNQPNQQFPQNQPNQQFPQNQPNQMGK